VLPLASGVRPSRRRHRALLLAAGRGRRQRRAAACNLTVAGASTSDLRPVPMRPRSSSGLLVLALLATTAHGDDAVPLASARSRPAAAATLAPDADDGCKAVTVNKHTTCKGDCKGNSTCELLDPTDPSTGCMCKAGPAPLPPVRLHASPAAASPFIRCSWLSSPWAPRSSAGSAGVAYVAGSLWSRRVPIPAVDPGPDLQLQVQAYLGRRWSAVHHCQLHRPRSEGGLARQLEQADLLHRQGLDD
jgi:hypothetical protein